MRYKVEKKQPNSSMCLVCGLDNPFGLKAFFYELENKELLGFFTAKDYHQSYPNRVHGGIISSILDETIGRAIMINHKTDQWGVTTSFKTKFLKPVPIGEEIKVLSRITFESRRCFEGTGEIILSNGEVAVRGIGRYLKMSLDSITSDYTHLDWKVHPSKCDCEYYEL